MKARRPNRRSRAFHVVSALVIAGCASGASAPAMAPRTPPAPMPTAIPSPTAIMTPTTTPSTVATATPIATTTPSTTGTPLSPPKATTIPLSSGGDSALDRALYAGDLAFEDGNLEVAGKQYESARNAAPTRAEPSVGLARVRIARTGLPLDYDAGRGNAEVAAAVRDLRKAADAAPTCGAALVE